VTRLAIRAGVTCPVDHQSQATEAWRRFAGGAASPAEHAVAGWPQPGLQTASACPDGGRGAAACGGVCSTISPPTAPFPCWLIWAPRLGVRTEFQPLTTETLRLVVSAFTASRATCLLRACGNDALDQKSAG